MDAEAEENFRRFVANRSTALLRTAVLLGGGDRHAAGRRQRIDEPWARR